MVLENLNVKIKKIKEVAELTKSFILEKPENFIYEPGQHVFIELSIDDGKPFSLVSSPHEDVLEFATIIRDSSEWNQELNNKQEGNELILSGPYGAFKYEDSEKDIAFIAGGIGITPFIGILRYLTEKGIDTKIVLLYSNKNRKRTAFRKELDDLSEKNKNINIIYTMTDDPEYEGNKSRIDKSFIKKHVEHITNKVWYIAGPPFMVDSFKLVLKELGVEKIKIDSFKGY